MEMVEVIFTHGGMLDKYLGDGLMAIFGAPVSSSSDADHALFVATDMIRALGRYNARRVERGDTPIEIGIGLATGEVLAGSVGMAKRMEYTVIGDNVNLAARLESANKYYGTAVLLSGTTVARADGGEVPRPNLEPRWGRRGSRTSCQFRTAAGPALARIGAACG